MFKVIFHVTIWECLLIYNNITIFRSSKILNGESNTINTMQPKSIHTNGINLNEFVNHATELMQSIADE